MITKQLLTETEVALHYIQQNELPLLQQSTDWQSKYRILMHLGKQLPPFPEALRQPEFLLTGCESNAWLLHYHEPLHDKHFFIIESDARIVKGLMALILSLVNGMSNDALQKFELAEAFDQLKLKAHLSQSRGNALAGMMAQIKRYAG